MKPTHTLRVVHASEGESTRDVFGTETIVLRANGELRSWPPRGIASLSVDDSGIACFVYSDNLGEYRNLRAADKIQVGSEIYTIGDHVSIDLVSIPTKPKVPEHEKPVSRTLKIPYRDPDRVPDVVTFASGEARIQGELVRERDYDEPVIFSARLDEIDVESIERVEVDP